MGREGNGNDGNGRKEGRRGAGGKLNGKMQAALCSGPLSSPNLAGAFDWLMMVVKH